MDNTKAALINGSVGKILFNMTLPMIVGMVGMVAGMSIAYILSGILSSIVLKKFLD